MTIKVAIQCEDRRTKETGTFGYFDTKPLYSVTPIFADYVQLVDYCKKHNITINNVQLILFAYNFLYYEGGI